MAVHCDKCGARVASRAALPGHYRKAHRGRRGGSRRAIVPAREPVSREPTDVELVACFGRWERPGPVQAEVLEVTPSRTEIVPAPRSLAAPKRSPRHILTPDLRDAERPPSWWEPQADPEWRIRQWNTFPADYRNRLLAQRAGIAFTIRVPQARDAVILRSQFHALKALATRLDGGVGTERERAVFEAALREYNANYDRVLSQKLAQR